MFTKDVQNTGRRRCPSVLNHSDHKWVSDLWERGNKMLHALKTLVLTPETKAYLAANDPKALEQAIEAVAFAERPRVY